jgi:hypothetical protein
LSVCNALSFYIGGCKGHWGVYGYMYMGCYTDQGFRVSFPLSDPYGDKVL